jgi:WD40 repeat protein
MGCHAVLKGHKGAINDLKVISNYNSIATGSDDCTVRIWDIKTGDTLRILEGHKRPIRCLLSHSNMLFVGSGDGNITVWNTSV